MKTYSIEKILEVMDKRNYIAFEKDAVNYNLNLVGVRCSDPTPNKFNDSLYVFWKHQGEWNLNLYRITTDPNVHYLHNPINPAGAAILKPGQYMGMWEIGLHRGKYKALVQVRPCVVIRDDNKDNKLDFKASKEQRGLFGINLHRALAHIEAPEDGAWSAGCQVFANGKDFDEFMELAEKARGFFGNSFTYTLLEEGDFE